MMAQLSFRSKRVIILLSRAAAGFLSVAGLMVYVILMNHDKVQRETFGIPSTSKPVYNYLPICALSFAVAWNCFSLVITGLGTARWFTDRLRNGTDFFTAIELAAFGYVSFVNCLVNQWRTLNKDDKVLQVVGILLLSLTGASQLLFFCFDCGRSFPKAAPLRSDEPESWLGQPSSYDGELREVKSFTTYSAESVAYPPPPPSPPQRSASVASNKLKPKPLSVYKKSGSLRRGSSVIRPVRPQSSASIPDYTPQGFVTVIGAEDDVETLSPVDVSRSPSTAYPNSKHNQSPNGSPVSPVSPNSPWSSTQQTSRFPIKIPARAHSRSKSNMVRSPDLADVPELPVHRRATSSPSPSNPFLDPTTTTIQTANSFTLPRAAPLPPNAAPPIAEHPAYAHQVGVPNFERRHDTPPLPPPISTVWGGQPYNDRKKFIPAYQETGGAFGAY